MTTNPKTPDVSSYDYPILSLNPETGHYRVIYEGCQVGEEIDAVGLREKIRERAKDA